MPFTFFLANTGQKEQKQPRHWTISHYNLHKITALTWYFPYLCCTLCDCTKLQTFHLLSSHTDSRTPARYEFKSISKIETFFVIKPTRCTNFKNLFCHECLHVSDSSSVLHQEFIHFTLNNGICHTGICHTAFEQGQDGTAVPLVSQERLSSLEFVRWSPQVFFRQWGAKIVHLKGTVGNFYRPCNMLTEAGQKVIIFEFPCNISL